MEQAGGDLIGVAIADDHPVVVDGLRAYLGQLPDMQVVGIASSGAEALDLARRQPPAVMILDLEMPPPSGDDLIAQLQQVAPGTRILVLTAHDSDENVIAALAAGAAGYVSKAAPVERVAEAVRQVHRGNISLRADLTSHLISRLMHAPAEPRSSESMLGITSREMEVLELLVGGATNEEIASRMYISVRTVKAHLTSIFRKLGVNRRTSAATVALRMGLVTGREGHGHDSSARPRRP